MVFFPTDFVELLKLSTRTFEEKQKEEGPRDAKSRVKEAGAQGPGAE